MAFMQAHLSDGFLCNLNNSHLWNVNIMRSYHHDMTLLTVNKLQCGFFFPALMEVFWLDHTHLFEFINGKKKAMIHSADK